MHVKIFVMLDKKLEYYSFDSIPISIIIEEIIYLISAYVIRDYIFYVQSWVNGSIKSEKDTCVCDLSAGRGVTSGRDRF